LAIVYLALKDKAAAREAFCEVLRLQADNPSVQHTLDILNQKENVSNSPPEYIQTLFDSYADHYDSHLLGPLAYQVPQLLYQVSKPYLPNRPLSILDLGAGTGLSGELFKSHSQRLVGVDLSEKMLALAAQKHIYQELLQKDILIYLSHAAETFDVILAGDLVVYFGDLQELFGQVAKHLKMNGLFIFNTEISEQAEYKLTETGRFAHQASYIEHLCKALGLNSLVKQTQPIRKHLNSPVQGNLFVLQKQG
jgi:predicted TPR repeat methyltransferase